MFSISNVLIQSSINSFGSQVMAGNTACSNLEGFVYTAMNSIYQAALSFVGQNMGAKKYSRISKIMKICLLLVFGVGLGMCLLMLLFGRPLLSIYSSDATVIDYGYLRMEIIFFTYYFCGMMDVMGGILLRHGILHSAHDRLPDGGVRPADSLDRHRLCLAAHPFYPVYFLPISWLITFVVHFICFLVVPRKLPRPTVNRPRWDRLPNPAEAEV